MDANKLKVLREIGYSIPKVCGLCRHADLVAGWGMCNIQTYHHLKHDEERYLSIYEHGSCPKWEKSVLKVAPIHGFIEFIEE